MRAWAAALLLAAAATAREVVRLGYFTEAQPFEVACARGWFEGDLDVEVVCLPQSAGVGACVEIKILRSVRVESSPRPPRHRCDACSIAWRCRFLTARPSQDGRAIAEK